MAAIGIVIVAVIVVAQTVVAAVGLYRARQQYPATTLVPSRHEPVWRVPLY
jgi:hypothetical protein